APAAEAIRGKALVVVPGGVLGRLPFELLVEPGGGPTGDGVYLAERHLTRYAPSLTALHVVRLWDAARRRPDRPFWALGDPVYSPSDPRAVPPPGGRPREARADAFPRLAASGAEVEHLRALMGASRDDVLVGPAAGEAAVKARSAGGELARYRVLHFAAH